MDKRRVTLVFKIMLRVKAAILTGLILLCLGCTTASADEGELYPVWWSPELGLDNLDIIDWRLQKEFPRGRQFHLATYDVKRIYTDELYDADHPELGFNWDLEQVNVVERWIDDCDTLIASTDEGFEIDQENPYWVHAFNIRAIYSAQCNALLALKQAKPATTSYVRDLVLDEHSMEFVPPLIGMGWGCRGLKELLQANRDGVTWRDFASGYFKKDQHPSYELTVLDENTISILNRFKLADSWSPDFVPSSVTIAIYGRGDFNRDGFDDLLIKWEQQILSTDGELYTLFSAVYVATRRTPGGVLRVVDLWGQTLMEPPGRCDVRSAIRESGNVQ